MQEDLDVMAYQPVQGVKLLTFKALALVVGLTVFAATMAHAENADCWGDDERQDISCRELTEGLLLSLRGATRAEVVKSMNAKGRESEQYHGWWHIHRSLTRKHFRGELRG